MITWVPLEKVDYVWSALSPMINKALKHGSGDGETAEHLYSEVMKEKMFMLVKYDGDEVIAGGVFSIQEHPAKKTLFVEILAGKNLKTWIDEVESVLHKLKEHLQADTIEAACRPGLTKMLKHWKPKATIMELM